MDSIDTKTKLLDAAEELFAEQGIYSTSVRKITCFAGTNLTSVHYYFGSKDALIRKVIARRITPVRDEQIQRLEALEDATGDAVPNLGELIRAFIEPVIRVRFADPQKTMIMLKNFYQLQTDSTGLLDSLFDQVADLIERYIGAFHKALPQLPAVELHLRFRFLLGVMQTLMAPHPFPNQVLEVGGELDSTRLLSYVVPFLVAGFETAETATPDEEKSDASLLNGHLKQRLHI